MRFRYLIVGAVALGAPVPARAQEWAASVVRDTTLRALIHEVLERNSAVSQQRAALAAAAQRVRPAGALPDPMLTAGMMNLSVPSFGIDPTGFTEVDAELAQEIPWPGLLGARTQVARAGEAIARAQLDVRRREVISALATSYYHLRYTVTAFRTLLRQYELLEAAVQLTTTRYATGVAPQSDPLQAKLARDRLRSEQLVLRADRTAALAAVNALRGHRADDSLSIQTIDLDSLRVHLPSPPAPDSLIALALARHPRLAARRAAVEQATGSIQAERRGGRPDFTVSVRYGYRPTVGSMNLPDFFSASLGLRIPLWAARSQHRLADAARFDSTAAAAGMHDEELTLSRDVTETAARADAARQRLVLLLDGILPAARGTVESVLRSYQVGRTEFLTLLAVEDAAFRAELEAAEIAADHETRLIMLRELTAEESGL